MYYSTSKGKYMEESQMHMMHIENVLLKDMEDDTLGWKETNRLTAAYIAKSKEDREKLHRMVKRATGLNRLLIDLISMPRAVFVKHQPAKPKPSVASVRYNQLDFYRSVALKHVGTAGYISADTLRSLLEQRRQRVNGQTLTHVFRDERFVQASYRRSEWDGAKGRYINVWKAA